MTIDPAVEAFEARRREAKVTADSVLKRSGVSAGTLWNWRRGMKPKAATLAKLNTALDEIIAERKPEPA